MIATNNSFHMRGHVRRIAQIVGLTTLALIAGIVGRFYLDLQDYAQDRVVEVGATYTPYNNVAEMTRDADLVVLGSVMGEGKTHLVPQTIQQPRAFRAPAATDLPDGKSNVVAQGTSSASGQSFDMPVTTFTIAVERVLHGDAQPKQLTVSQPGGKVVTPTFPGGPQITRTVQFEHDPALQSGERQLLFLRSAGDGTYYVVGGPQGRLTIDRTEKVHPIDRAAPAVRGRDGERVDVLLSDVAAIH